ncbi:hypothetical protein M427DRAFT_168552 [Gonapodya prolifera JEL478]|uniref:Uncharacterized protein n=1 Tax=Gonapodya prolifera (strain JEL478) TaxID=1344416 RepID=A0A139B011_GONPJ|nr:hypothetical protein M427DRAFT_168552 [Gonapodya prolifera JEL478]|eukprot:KXS22280.1 hypothetical protein M427DRAFT_168552 [Gonapodya prolifera JEL478]
MRRRPSISEWWSTSCVVADRRIFCLVMASGAILLRLADHSRDLPPPPAGDVSAVWRPLHEMRAEHKRGANAFDQWLRSRFEVGEDDGADGGGIIWSKFVDKMVAFEGLFHHLPTFLAYHTLLFTHLSLPPCPVPHIELRMCPFTPYVLPSDNTASLGLTHPISATLTFSHAMAALSRHISSLPAGRPSVRLIYAVPRSAITSWHDLASHLDEFTALRSTCPALFAGFDVVGADSAAGWSLPEFLPRAYETIPEIVESTKYFWHAGQELESCASRQGWANLETAVGGVHVGQGKKVGRAVRVGHGCLACAVRGGNMAGGAEDTPAVFAPPSSAVDLLSAYLDPASSSSLSVSAEPLPRLCLESQPISNHLFLGIRDWASEWSHLPTAVHKSFTSPSSITAQTLSVVIGPDDPACWGLGATGSRATNLTGWDLVYVAVAFPWGRGGGDIGVTLLEALERVARWSVEWPEVGGEAEKRELTERWEGLWERWVEGVAALA